ncbi:Biotin carboxylase [Aneurinibacillus thermoaerophilus]|uniref:Biotin carboxylase n=2 Tax=Aneurinibacillus thermoaerophilus TaxID=143495 RepID=A0A1G8APT3_ANETH|nr:Biotin carboxylase [Aneurinibacillus thermoaerophilus]
MMKNLLFIESNTTGTGARAMKIAKQLGYQIHFWTVNPQQYKAIVDDNPLELADKVTVIDTYNIDLMKEELERSNVNFDGILAFDDYHLIPAAELTKFLGLKGHNIESLNRVRYKHLTRSYLAEHNFRDFLQPSFHIVNCLEDLIDLKIQFPCVIKPVDDSGSNGVSICQNYNDLESSLLAELQRQHNERGYKLTRKWLIEEFIKGQEFSAEMLYTTGGWKLVSVTKKETYGSHAVECGHVTGPEINPIYDLEERCKKLLDILGLNYGAAHIEFFISGKDLYLVEVNPRLAGDCIPELVEISTGVDMVKHIVLQAIGELTDINIVKQGYAAIKFILPFERGIYTDVRGIDEAQSVKGVKRVSIVQLPFRAESIKSSYQRLGFVIAEGDSMEKAIHFTQTAINMLKWSVVYE